MTKPELVDLAKSCDIMLDPVLLIDYPVGTYFWAVHHNIVMEELDEPLINRLAYILNYKLWHEHKARIKAIRPVQDPVRLASTLVAYDASVSPVWEALAKGRDRSLNETNRVWEESRRLYNEYLLPQWNEEYPDHPMFYPDVGLVMS